LNQSWSSIAVTAEDGLALLHKSVDAFKKIGRVKTCALIDRFKVERGG